MYRKNQLLGCMLLSFGLGLLLGLWLEGGFFAHCFAFGIMIFGGCFIRKK